MTTTADGLYAAGLALEEDIRKMDAGELKATPERRAFLMGAKNALLGHRIAESGGFPVDATVTSHPTAETAAAGHGSEPFRPENLVLADTETTAFDGGEPASQQDGPRLDGGKP